MKSKATPGQFITTFQGAISVIMAMVTIAVLFLFWRYADQRHTDQLLLVRIEAAINLTNGLEWQTTSGKHVTPEERRELADSLEQIESIFRELDPKIRASPQVQHIHTHSLEYAAAVTRESSLFDKGAFDEAHEIDETVVDPTLQKTASGVDGGEPSAGKESEGGVAHSNSRFRFRGGLIDRDPPPQSTEIPCGTIDSGSCEPRQERVSGQYEP
jgi:hypothetical protein